MNASTSALLVCLLLVAAPAGAQSDRPKAVVRPTRIDTPPQIDGRLDEPFWADIEPITDFRQFEPDNGEPATERTEMRIAYDNDFLYFGVRAYDSEPDKIIARQFERDSLVDNDDSVAVEIDSLNNNRTGFMFQTNVLGAQFDAEFAEDRSMNVAWDTIWYSAGNIDELGYTVEIAIPFFALRFQPAAEVEMGIYLERMIRRRNERVSWPGLSRDYSYFSVSQFNRMNGLDGIERGVNLEVKPYGTGGYSEVPEETLWDADAGLDLKWGMTSNLTTDLTFNPDFAQVESDALRINLTRFSLFFPEKREFFLERADLFTFGLPREAEVFFSRRIGISGREEVPIIAGARTYGLAGSTNIGLLTMQTGSAGGFDGENFTVARVKQNLFGRSYVGGIFTSRQGETSRGNTSAGGDFSFLFGTNSRVEASVARSNHTGVETGNWFTNASASTNVDLYDWRVQYTDVGERFDPGIGFVRRRDLKRWRTSGHFKPRPGWKGVRQLNFGADFEHIENHAGELETRVIRPRFLMTFQTEDSFTLTYSDIFDNVPFAFSVAPGVIIPAGEYTNREVSLAVRTTPARWWSINATHARGSFYDGDRRNSRLNVTVRPIPRINVRLENTFDHVDVPGGSFDSLISRLFFSYYFSPLLTTRLGMQYSTLFNEYVLNFRIRWIYSPGSEAWVVYDEGRQFIGLGPSLRERAFILKVVHNFNF